MTENEIKKMHKEYTETVRKELINAARKIKRACNEHYNATDVRFLQRM